MDVRKDFQIPLSDEEKDNEIWRPITCYPPYTDGYEISNMGRYRNTRGKYAYTKRVGTESTNAHGKTYMKGTFSKILFKLLSLKGLKNTSLNK